MEAGTLTRWPHQVQGVEQTVERIEAGAKSICLTAPTGAGKSLMMVDLIEWARNRDWSVNLYSVRKLLTEQLIRVLTNERIGFGVRAAEFQEFEDHSQAVQICSSSTEASRVFRRREKLGTGLSEAQRRQQWQLHPADLVIFDEPHMQKAATCEKIAREHEEQGAVRVGFTATPLGLSHLYDELVVAGTNSELRKCGALVPCHVYAPDEPDCRKLEPKTKTGEYSVEDIRKYIWTTSIFGRVIDHMKRYNPDMRPTIVFWPGVKESIWGTDEFRKVGIRAGHIDGTNCYLDGEEYQSSRSAREEIIQGNKDGTIPIICNRFVMREGIDLPWLYHCILATPIGSLLSYVQTVGRVLRAHESLDHVIVQDHGGNWWRHGSPNADRDWADYFHGPERIAGEMRLEGLREGKISEPIVCPQCGAVRNHGATCASCGFQHTTRSRMVLQKDGALVSVDGPIIKPRIPKLKPDTEAIWKRMYYRMKCSGMTFRQAEGLFFYERHYWPPRDLPLMPRDAMDWFREIKAVPMERLR